MCGPAFSHSTPSGVGRSDPAGEDANTAVGAWRTEHVDSITCSGGSILLAGWSDGIPSEAGGSR